MGHHPRIKGIGRISLFFTKNKPLSILLLATIVLFGFVAFLLTPKQYNPEIVRPAFGIELKYQGASVEDAIDRVVYELVEKVQTVPGVDDVFTEVRDGTTIHTTVIFEVGHDATEAKLDLLSQLNQHSYLARGFITEPHVIEINPETIPILQIVFASEILSLDGLRDKIVRLSHELGDIEGVSELSVYGGYTPTLVVELDPQKLAAENIRVAEVVQTLKANQSRMVSDGIHAEEHQLAFVFENQTQDPTETGLLFINDTVRLRDVARIYTGTIGDRAYVFHHQSDTPKETVVLSVAKVEGSSAPRVASAFSSSLDQLLKEDTYQSLTYKVVSNDGETANNEIYGLTKNLLSSIFIVAAVLLLFLSSRAALVVLIAIPMTLLVVFALGYLFDQTINRITLFALILSLGLLVDSAIVVVENIHTHLKEWKNNPHIAEREFFVARAVQEVGVGLLLSTVTSVIVFLPMLYITGMMGPYMGPIAFFVPVALVVSFFVAIIITPFIATHTLDKEHTPNRVTAFFSQLLTRITSTYSRFLQRILASRFRQKRLLQGALFVFLVSLFLPIFGLVHFQMLPRADRDQFYVYLDFPVDTNVETNRGLSEEVSNLLLEDPNVLNIQQFVATPPVLDFNGMFKGAEGRNAPYQTTLRVNLLENKQRDENSTNIVTRLRTQLEKEQPDTSTHVRFIEEPPGPPVRATFVAKISARDSEVRRIASGSFFDFIQNIDGITDTYTTEDEPVIRVRYTFDHEAAQHLGVSLDDVYTTLALQDGVEATEFVGADAIEYTPIVVGLDAAYRNTLSGIETLTVTSSLDKPVPLQSVLHISHEARPSKANLEGATPVSYVTAEVEGRSIVYVVIDTMRALLKGEFTGYSVTDWGLFSMNLKDEESQQEITIYWGGEWEMTLENFRDLGIAMGVALLMVYAVLVAQYRRFAVPAFILVTVPLGLVGILWGFLLLDTVFNIYLTATALIGFIALIGIVVNNAIIFLEYVEQMKQKGLEYHEALLAAGEARLRPILLTSMTTVLGSLTIASDQVWSGLAWAIVFGLSISTILTLIVYPTLLMYFTQKNG